MADYVDAGESFLHRVQQMEQRNLELEAAIIKVYEEVDRKGTNTINAGVILDIVKPVVEGGTHAREKIQKHKEPESLRGFEEPGEVEDNRSQDI